jgi:hypothetical protein
MDRRDFFNKLGVFSAVVAGTALLGGAASGCYGDYDDYCDYLDYCDYSDYADTYCDYFDVCSL